MAKSSEKTQTIVVKKKKGGHGGHHGGAWKIAYADFVTAMMAFFLLMWLLGSTTKGELMGIAEYFQTPLQVALFGGSGAGDASSVINGGGQDLTRSAGQVKRGDSQEQKKVVNIRSARAELDLPTRVDSAQTTTGAGSGDGAAGSAKATAEAADAKALGTLKVKIEDMIDAVPGLAAFKKQLVLELTEEGLRIQIIDDQNRPMFDISSSTLKPYAVEILDDIAIALAEVPNQITITGHTDSTPYKNGAGGLSNWELSAERANAARREMARIGLPDEKILRVVGHGASAHFKPDAPTDPINRRISIVVLKRNFASLASPAADTEKNAEQTAPKSAEAPASKPLDAAASTPAPSKTTP
jgi:chemotaxis protein MotB